MAYLVDLSPDAQSQLRALTARERMILLNAMDEQLLHEPNVETRHRKPLRPNPIAPWELRVGDFRIYYSLPDDPAMTVIIVAVGKKVRDRVLIDDEEIEI